MGDRALIIFKQGNKIAETSYSPVVYLHWGGSDVPELLRKTRTLMESRGPDLDYTAARFVGICNESMKGNLSLGLWSLPVGFGSWSKKKKEDYSHGDAGIVVVDVDTWKFKQFGAYYKLDQIVSPKNRG